MAAPVLVYTTCPDSAVAARIGRRLVEERLCACVNIVPGMHSIYRWQGEVLAADEVVLIAKTMDDRADALGIRLRELHPYQEPCVLVIPVTGGSPTYISWLAEGSRPV